MVLKVILCLVPIILLGGLAYWFYLQPSFQLPAKRKAVLDKAFSFLNQFLWNSSAYRECPVFSGASCATNFSSEDNYPGYIFNADYANQTKAMRIHNFLATRNFSYYNRWIVLSNQPSNYTRYPCSTCIQTTPYDDSHYSDHAALDGIYDWKVVNVTGARERFNFLVGHTLDTRLGLLRDDATGTEGFVYYKLSLALILASELGNSKYVTQFSETLASQQNLDGSWLTGPARPGGVFPNTESTILCVIALKLAWNL